MEFKTHPILNELEVNEDGSKMKLHGKELTIKTYDRSRDNYAQKKVCFNNRTHSVPKLINETWNGMREDMTLVTCRKDYNPDNDHYSNLYWGKRGDTQSARFTRAKSSKIKDSDIPKILDIIVAGEYLTLIAKSYGTTDTTIGRVKKRYLTDSRLKLKEAIKTAKNEYQHKKAISNYLKCRSIAEAIVQYGKGVFELSINQLITIA